MKKLLLASLASCVFTFAFSQQQLENPGFEDVWEDVTGTEDEPLEWSSLKTSNFGDVAPLVAYKETSNPHSGNYCIRLVNTSSFGVVANGLLTNGRVQAAFDPEDGYVFTNTADPKWNTPLTSRPDSLVGWFRYDPETGDQGKVEVILHTAPPQGKLPAANYPEAHWVGRARYDITTTSTTTWVRFSVPFTYYNISAPQYVLAVISAGDSTQAVEGSILWVDDLELIYNDNIASIAPSATQNISMGVNGTTLTLTATPNAASTAAITQEWKYSTTSGSGYVSFGTAETGTTYTPNFATPGIYYVVCEVDFGTETIITNEVEIVVTDPGANTVTISPSANQTLLVDQNGTMLTATETPASASSREWKYSTTSGSGHVSFGTPETGTTYTPNFDAVGTYYIICESDFSGDIQTSNEVTIFVPSAAGISEGNLQFNIYGNALGLNIHLSDVQNNSVLNIFSLDGKLIYTSAINETYTTHQVECSGVVIYSITSGDRIITGKINL